MSVSDPAVTYARIRELAFSDPLAAKRNVITLLDGDVTFLRAVLAHASAPGDGRVRQLVARAVHRRNDKDRIVDILLDWRACETDEFSLIALNDALSEVPRPSRQKSQPTDLPDLASTFRYVSRRLRHRILNIMPRAGLSLDELTEQILSSMESHQGHPILPLLDDLKNSLRRLERAVDFDQEDRYFQPKRIQLADWIEQFSPKFQASHGPTEIRGTFASCRGGSAVWASEYLLDLVFTNLWMNSRQAVSGPCEINNRGASEASFTLVTVVDNGSGLSEADVERGFNLQFSTKGRDRGRGHMEVAEAMGRLGGSASVRLIPADGYRVVLSFPRLRR